MGEGTGRALAPALSEVDYCSLFVAYCFSSIYEFTFILPCTVFSFVSRFIYLDFCTTVADASVCLNGVKEQ